MPFSKMSYVAKARVTGLMEDFGKRFLPQTIIGSDDRQIILRGIRQAAAAASDEAEPDPLFRIAVPALGHPPKIPEDWTEEQRQDYEADRQKKRKEQRSLMNAKRFTKYARTVTSMAAALTISRSRRWGWRRSGQVLMRAAAGIMVLAASWVRKGQLGSTLC